MSYALTNNPVGNAYISGNTVVVQGDYRKNSYQLGVAASNPYGTSATKSFSVSESGYPVPTKIKNFDGITLQNNTMTYNLNDYFNGATSFGFRDSYEGATINGATLNVTGNYRGRNYRLLVFGSNQGGESEENAVMYITEEARVFTSRVTISWIGRSGESPPVGASITFRKGKYDVLIPLPYYPQTQFNANDVPKFETYTMKIYVDVDGEGYNNEVVGRFSYMSYGGDLRKGQYVRSDMFGTYQELYVSQGWPRPTVSLEIF